MVPTDTLTSMLLEPSSGSVINRYLPRWCFGGIWYGPSISSEAIPANWPDHSVCRLRISLLIRSSGCCSSPWTFVVPLAVESASEPKAMRRAMAFTAMDTSSISALKSPLASGNRRRSSMR